MKNYALVRGIFTNNLAFNYSLLGRTNRHIMGSDICGSLATKHENNTSFLGITLSVVIITRPLQVETILDSPAPRQAFQPGIICSRYWLTNIVLHKIIL